MSKSLTNWLNNFCSLVLKKLRILVKIDDLIIEVKVKVICMGHITENESEIVG
jgi:hypothetical protein